jgi:hypothetical protein
MTIQRQYSLPNCTLVLEGVGEEPKDPMARPLLTMLINAECRFVGYDEPLTGGHEFFDNLVKTVSQYAQEVLSGVAPSTSHRHPLVQLQRSEKNLHRLTVRSPQDSNGNGGTGDHTRELNLTTVQLFDLVEAVDQALADTQTLPHLSLQLTPVSRRRAGSGEPLAKRALPVAVGASSLAIVAAALFFLPVPEVRRPQETETQSTAQPSPDTTEGTAQTAAGTPPDETGATNEDLSALEETLENAPPITDPETISALNEELRTQIDDAWTQEPTFEDDLIYRVAVTEQGDIVGYKYVNPEALDYVDETPLPDLTYQTPENSPPSREPIGQYRVVFTPAGVLEVSPWYSVPENNNVSSNRAQPSPSPQVQQSSASALAPQAQRQPSTTSSASTQTAPERVTDLDRLEQLNNDLYDLLQEERAPQDYPADLIYRVTFNEAGAVVGYEPVNQPARDYLEDTPLPDLTQAARRSTSANAPQNDFMVVFTERGVLEVNPWDGWE